jgi:PhoD related phosphatase
MKNLLGPLLRFQGLDGAKWNVSALVLCGASDDPGFICDGKSIKGQAVFLLRGKKAIRYDLELEQTATERRIEYSLEEGTEGHFYIPASGENATMAYTSCNGFSEARLMKQTKEPNSLWKTLYTRHQSVYEGSHYHLLLMGGDQVYADQVWELPSIKRWLELPRAVRCKRAFTKQMHQHVESFYFDLYLSRWSQPDVEQVLTSIPTIMMWDDHDIFDGWGSYYEDDQSCPVYQGIFAIARSFFKLFQLHLAPDQEPQNPLLYPSFATNFSCCYRVADIAIIALDLRSERTQSQVMGRQSWDMVYQWMDTCTSSCSHVLIMSSIPVVHPDFSALEWTLGVLPGQQSLEDDLRDHWYSKHHKAERLRLIHRLLKLSLDKDLQVTILSGDVHVAALGIVTGRDVQNRGGHLYQLTSSAIVHPAPPGMVLLALDLLSKGVEEVAVGVTAQMLQFPTTNRKFIGARNFLSLEPDEQGRIWSNWIVEGEEDSPYTQVILPAS